MFWRKGEQSSEQCLMSLRDRRVELGGKGVAVLTAEAFGANMKQLRSWASEKKVTFLVGSLKERRGPRD